MKGDPTLEARRWSLFSSMLLDFPNFSISNLVWLRMLLWYPGHSRRWHEPSCFSSNLPVATRLRRNTNSFQNPYFATLVCMKEPNTCLCATNKRCLSFRALDVTKTSKGAAERSPKRTLCSWCVTQPKKRLVSQLGAE